MPQRSDVDEGLKHLKSSEEVIGKIVSYCVRAHKSDPSPKTTAQIRQYVIDTANSVCSHVLNVANSIQSVLDNETQDIDEMANRLKYLQHRMKSHQTYMSQLYMTKFQTLPRPTPHTAVLRETVSNDELPKYSRPHKPWRRAGRFDYHVLDTVGTRKGPSSDSSKYPSRQATLSRVDSLQLASAQFGTHKAEQKESAPVAPPSFSSFAAPPPVFGKAPSKAQGPPPVPVKAKGPPPSPVPPRPPRPPH